MLPVISHFFCFESLLNVITDQAFGSNKRRKAEIKNLNFREFFSEV
jgi:hypothetical protein